MQATPVRPATRAPGENGPDRWNRWNRESNDQFIDQAIDRRDAVDHRFDGRFLVEGRQHRRNRRPAFAASNSPGRCQVSGQRARGAPPARSPGDQLRCCRASPLTRARRPDPLNRCHHFQHPPVAATSCTRNMRAPAAATNAVAASVPPSRSVKSTPSLPRQRPCCSKPSAGRSH